MTKTPAPSLALEVIRHDDRLTAFTAEENYLLVRGMEILARVSPSKGGWKVAWPMHDRFFPTKEKALGWLHEHLDEVVALPVYPR